MTPGERSRPGLLLRLSFLLPLLLLSGCHPDRGVHNSRFLAFGTLVDLTMADVSREQAEAAASAIEQDFQRMNRAWHAWNPGPLGRVNKLLETGGWFSAPPSILPLVQRGKALSAVSDDLFNPAIGRLIEAWGFLRDDPENGRPPPPERIRELLRQNPRMGDIDIDGIRMRSRNPAVRLDFGAFAKGYGIDLAVAHLRELGIDNAILNAGGDLRAIGSRLGVPWRIAIRRPGGSGMLGVVEVEGDESVFTSGDYERKFEWEGRRYSHIIDPRSGWPARGTTSVTVIHDDSTTADAAATALFVAGPDHWYRLARRMGLRYVLLVDDSGTLHMNPAMQRRLQLVDDDRKIVLSPPLTDP